MKQMIIVLAEVACLATFAANIEKPKCEKSETAVMVAGPSEDGKVTREQWKAMTPAERKAAMAKMKAENATGREKSEAARLGIPLEKWVMMTKKDRKTIRQEALAKSKGMTVEEMKAERTRKEAEKVGCPVEKWAAMTVKERCDYRKALKAAKDTKES